MNKVIDLHELTVFEAKEELDKFMDRLPMGYMEVVVVHGFHGGTRLKTFVSKYQHPRIKRKLKTLNKGETIFVCV
jgi:DNA-nicking Smr family endonuclease